MSVSPSDLTPWGPEPLDDDGAVRHRLQLPRGTDPADVLAMVRNLRPGAVAAPDGTIELGEGASLVPDTGPRGAGRFDLVVDRDREDPAPEGLDDLHGYGRAFPDGLPFGAERRALDLAWSLARRLHGAVVTDGGVRLEPHPFHVRDLTVVSPYALAPGSLAELVAPLEPEAELDAAPEDSPRTGYGLSIPVEDGGHIALQVGRGVPAAALASLDWAQDAVDYTISHHPFVEGEEETERPDAETAARWEAVYLRIGRLAGVLTEAVGGYVVDLEGLLVDPADLA